MSAYVVPSHVILFAGGGRIRKGAECQAKPACSASLQYIRQSVRVDSRCHQVWRRLGCLEELTHHHQHADGRGGIREECGPCDG